MIKIEQAQNGWILTDEYKNDEGDVIEEKQVFSYDDECERDEARKNEVEAFTQLLWSLNEKVGVLYSKHEAYNLSIECEKNE
jgi:hypothetical protein